MSQISERYAEALFSLAKDENKVVAMREEALEILTVFDNEVAKFLDYSGINKKDKQKVLLEAFDSVDINFKHLFCLLVDTGRGYYTKEILKEFIKLCNEELDIQEVMVYSANKLSDADLNLIRDAIAKKLGKTVVVNNRIDKTLIAGTRIYINDRVYDSSLKAKVSHLKDELLKESW